MCVCVVYTGVLTRHLHVLLLVVPIHWTPWKLIRYSQSLTPCSHIEKVVFFFLSYEFTAGSQSYDYSLWLSPLCALMNLHTFSACQFISVREKRSNFLMPTLALLSTHYFHYGLTHCIIHAVNASFIYFLIIHFFHPLVLCLFCNLMSLQAMIFIQEMPTK